MHRLLAYYADMARKRREADRQSKRRCPGGCQTSPEGDCIVDQTTEEDADPTAEAPDPDEDQCATQGHYAGSVQLIENLHSPRSADDDSFAQVAEHIRELRGLECDAHCQRWEYRLEGESQPSVTIVMRCECGHVVKIAMAVDEFAEHAEKVLQWTRPAPAGQTKGVEAPSGES
ncbi:MAG: hypothetical protein ABFD16_13775 [Thermoguttaceae bacterium]